MADNELVININGDASDFNKAVGGVGVNLKKVAAVSGALFVGLSAGIATTVKQFAKFDNDLTAVRTLLDESSFSSKTLNEGFNDLRTGLLGVASQFPVSIEGLNKALFDTVSAGIDASKSIEFVSVAAKLGVAGLADVSVTTDGLTTATNAFGLSADNAESTAAKFFTAQKFGKTTIEELSGSLGVVAASASSAGVSFEEVLGAVSAATLAGVKTNAAFTSLKAVFANVVKPTTDATDEAARLGVEFNSTALRSKGLAQFLDDLTKAEGFNASSAEKLFGSVEALNVIQALTGNQSEKFKEILTELTDETKLATTFNQAFEDQNSTLANQLSTLGNQVTTIAIKLGQQFAPIVAKVVNLLKGFITRISENEDVIKKLAIAIGVVTGGAGLVFAIASIGLIVPLVTAGLATLTTAFATAGGAAALLASATGIGAIAFAVGVAIFNMDKLVNFFTGPLFATFQFIQDAVGGLVTKFVAAFKAIGFLITGNLTKANEQAKISLKPLRTIFFEAAKNAGEAFDEGQKIGLIEQAKNNKQLVNQEKETSKEIVDIGKKRSSDESSVAETRRKDQEDIANKKKKSITDIEQDLAFDLLEIDELLGNDQVAAFTNTTNQLVNAAQTRADSLADAATGGGGGARAREDVTETLVPKGSPLRELLDNPEQFVFGPSGFKRRRGVVAQNAPGLLFQEGFSGRDTIPARISPGEIVIPETFSEGIRSGRFALVGGNQAGGGSGGTAKVEISFRGNASRILTAKQNEDKSLGISRAR